MHDTPVYHSITFIAQNDQTNSIVGGWLFHSPDIIDYISPVPLSYFVKTRLNATELAQKMEFLFPEGRFLIAQIVPADFNGRMPTPFWDWFYGKNDAIGVKAQNIKSLHDATRRS